RTVRARNSLLQFTDFLQALQGPFQRFPLYLESERRCRSVAGEFLHLRNALAERRKFLFRNLTALAESNNFIADACDRCKRRPGVRTAEQLAHRPEKTRAGNAA